MRFFLGLLALLLLASCSSASDSSESGDVKLLEEKDFSQSLSNEVKQLERQVIDLTDSLETNKALLDEKRLMPEYFPDVIIDAFFGYEPAEKILSLRQIGDLDEAEKAAMAKKIGFTVEQINDYTSAERYYGQDRRPVSDEVVKAFGHRESCAGQPLGRAGKCSPDGSTILPDTLIPHRDCDSDLLIVRSDGSTERLTANEFHMDRTLGSSQDGQEILFTRARYWASSCSYSHEELWSISYDGTNERRLGTFGSINQSGVSFNSWKLPPHLINIYDAGSDEKQQYVWIDNPEGKGFTYERTYGHRVEIWGNGRNFLVSPMTVDQGTNLRGIQLSRDKYLESEYDYWEIGAIREAVDAAAEVAKKNATWKVDRFAEGFAVNGIKVDGFYLSRFNAFKGAFVFIGGGDKQGISVPVAIYMPELDCTEIGAGIAGVEEALLKWVLGALQDFRKDYPDQRDWRAGSEWPYFNGSYYLDEQWGSRAARVLAPLDWEPEFKDGCGSGSTTTWRKHSNPDSKDRIRVHTGVQRADWFETDGVKDSINPLYLPEGATVTQLSRTVFVYEIQNNMNVVGVWRVLGDDDAYTEATLHLQHRDTSFMNAFVTHQLQVVAGTDLNYRVAE